MYLSGFASIAADLHTDMATVQWSLSTFFFGLCLGQLLYGPIIDAWGRRVPLLVGVALFIVTALIGGLTHNITVFVGLRLLQAMGGCAGMIVSRAIINDLLEEREAARALSTLMVVMSLGPIVAPILGGYLLSFGWRSIFYFLVAFGSLCLIAAYFIVPESLPPARRAPMNAGAVLRMFARLLTRPGFLIPALSSSFAMASMFVFISGSPFVFMTLHGAGQREYGWLFGINAFGMVLTSQLNRMLLKHFSTRRLFACALTVHLLASLALVLLAGSASLAVVMTPLFFCIASLPLLVANGVAIAMSRGTDGAGSASSLIGVMQFALASLVSALLSVLQNGTAYPLGGLICACALAAALTSLIGRKAL